MLKHMNNFCSESDYINSHLNFKNHNQSSDSKNTLGEYTGHLLGEHALSGTYHDCSGFTDTYTPSGTYIHQQIPIT